MNGRQRKTLRGDNKCYNILQEGWQGIQKAEVGRQICRQAGSDSDRKLRKPTDAGSEADSHLKKSQIDR